MKYCLLLLLALGLLATASAKPHEGKKSHVTKRTREHELTNRMGHGDHHRRDHSAGHKGNSTHSPHRTSQHKTDGVHKGSAHRAATNHRIETNNHDLKKDLQLQHITEHNIEKKHEDKQKQAGEALPKHLVTNRVPSGEAQTPSHLLTNKTPKLPPQAPPSPSPKDGKGSKNGTKDVIPMESERLIHVTPRPPKAHKVNKSHHKLAQATAPAASPATHTNAPAPKPKVHKPPKKYSPKKHGWKKSLRKEKGKDKAKDKAKEKRERREKRNKALHRTIIARKL